jgi:hypothetical protein
MKIVRDSYYIEKEKRDEEIRPLMEAIKQNLPKLKKHFISVTDYRITIYKNGKSNHPIGIKK